MTEKHEFTPEDQSASPEGHDERMREKFDNQETLTEKRSQEKPEEKAEDKPEETPGGEAPEKPEETEDKPEGEQKAPSAGDFQKYTDEFNENGELSEDTYKELQEKYNLPKEIVDNYVHSTKAAAQAVTQAGMAAAGGEEEFGKITEWAKANLSESEISQFNEAVGTSDVSQAVKAVSDLKARFIEAKGEEPSLVEGNGNPRNVSGYRSRAEMSADMRDPRYKNDPAFRAEVQRKIQISTAI